MQTARTQVRRTAILLGTGAALLLVLVLASIVLTFRGEANTRRVMEERELRRASVDLLSAMQDAELGERGYLLTGDRAFLAPYEASRERLPAMRAEWAEFLLRSPEEPESVLAVADPLIERRLALIEAAIALGPGPRDAAFVQGEVEGKAAMDDLRALLDQLIARSDERFLSAAAEQRRLNRAAQVAVVVGALATALVVGLAFLALSRQFLALRRADLDLTRLNASLEERVASRTRDLIRANQEVQRFAYIVTHDLRAPLVNIMGFTSELDASMKAIQAALVPPEGREPTEMDRQEARVAAAEDLPEALGFIRASTRKMDGLINAILKISRDGRRELRPETVDLRGLAEQAVDAVAHQVAETGGEARVEAVVSAIVSDRLSVEQALGNLVDNAVKYAQPGRPLRLAVRILPDGPRRVRIEVEDNGRGIAAADHERVFDLFRRAGRQDQKGEGIGLAHVRSLVRNLGGEITLRSREGEGSTFTLELPADLRQVREAQGA